MIILVNHEYNDYLRVLLNNTKYFPPLRINDNDKIDLLQLAIMNQDWEMIPEIIPHISDINLQTSNGCTSLHLAVLFNAPSNVIEQLIAGGCRKDIKDNDGYTAYEYYKTRVKIYDEKKLLLLK